MFTHRSPAWHATCPEAGIRTVGNMIKELKKITEEKNTIKERKAETMKLNSLETNKHSKLGIAMTEYLIILGVIAVAAILVVGLFGKQVKQVFTRNNAALTGQTLGTKDADATVTASTGASVQDNMGSFDASANATGK